MKNLLKILLGALLSFQLVAIVQEWPVFAAAWLGERPGPAVVPLAAGDREGAERALREYHALSRHLYATAGDPRFTDRLPASDLVKNELLADIAYLQHSGLAQEPSLVRLDVVAARRLGEQTVALETREYWVVSLLKAADRQPVEPPRSQIFWGTYRLRRESGSWRVDAWEVLDPPLEPDGADGGG